MKLIEKILNAISTFIGAMISTISFLCLIGVISGAIKTDKYIVGIIFLSLFFIAGMFMFISSFNSQSKNDK